MKWYNTKIGKVVRSPVVVLVWIFGTAILAGWFFVGFWFQLGNKMLTDEWTEGYWF